LKKKIIIEIMSLLNVVKFVLDPFDLAVLVCYNCVDDRVMTLNVN